MKVPGIIAIAVGLILTASQLVTAAPTQVLILAGLTLAFFGGLAVTDAAHNKEHTS